MKQKITLLVLLFFSVIFLFGQTPKKHKMKMYTAPDGKFYVNRNRPMYLFLSDSPNPDGEKKKLESQSSPQYTNPFYFDVDGYNTVRTPSKVDTVTKKVVLPKSDIIFEVYADGTAPKSTVTFTGAKKYTASDGTVFYGKGLELELKAKDAVSGVEDIYYTINGEEFNKYSSRLNADKEKNYALKFYALDNVGNVEKVKTREFVVDHTPPVVSYEIDGSQKEHIVSASGVITLKAEDALSGVKAIKYSFNGKAPKTYTGKIPLSELTDNEHEIVLYAIDNVGNSGEKKSSNHEFAKHNFYLDRTAPKVNASIKGDQHEGKYLYISTRSKCKIEAQDNKSGVEVINYSIDNWNFNEVFTSPFSLLDKAGLQTINYKAIDKVKNASKGKKLVVFMDNLPPSTGIIYGQPKFFNRDTLFIAAKTKITLFSKDIYSGVRKTEYAIDGGKMQTYEKFTIPTEGFHKITFKATDNVNNVEQVKESHVLVDNNAPEIYVKFSIQPIRTENKDGKIINVYPKYVRMYLAATDRYSGTESIHYTINDGKLMSYSSERNLATENMFTKEQIYKVKVVAKDKLGNENEKTVEFKVSSK